MHNVEWSLIIFTLLSQFSVGVMVSLLVYQLLAGKDNPEAGTLLIRKGLYTALTLKAIALMVSFLHLSSPLQSVFALSNLGTSWLSREILMASVYAFLVFLAVVYIHFRKRKNIITLLLTALAVVSGIYLVYTMARLYMIPTVPAWNTPLTIAGFISSILLVSPVLIIIFSIIMTKKGKTIPALNKLMFYLSILVFSGLLIRLTGSFLFRPGIPVDMNIGFMAQEVGFWIRSLYWVLLGAGAWLLISHINEILKNRLPGLAGSYLLLVCFISAEVISRALFYYSFYRIGL
jgi:anaerobic dimethyl sulfoxide reductase subunit C (anchor subunit)